MPIPRGAKMLLCAQLLLVSIPARMVAQSRDGLRVGLAPLGAPRAPINVALVDPREHSRWAKGAIIGGLAGLGLAVLINTLSSDISNKNLRAIEFGFGGAIIGGLIGS
jgi:hypothetical protein